MKVWDQVKVVIEEALAIGMVIAEVIGEATDITEVADAKS